VGVGIKAVVTNHDLSLIRDVGSDSGYEFQGDFSAITGVRQKSLLGVWRWSILWGNDVPRESFGRTGTSGDRPGSGGFFRTPVLWDSGLDLS
jgi:hypothetical protein